MCGSVLSGRRLPAAVQPIIGQKAVIDVSAGDLHAAAGNGSEQRDQFPAAPLCHGEGALEHGPFAPARGAIGQQEPDAPARLVQPGGIAPQPALLDHSKREAAVGEGEQLLAAERRRRLHEQRARQGESGKVHRAIMRDLASAAQREREAA